MFLKEVQHFSGALKIDYHSATTNLTVARKFDVRRRTTTWTRTFTARHSQTGDIMRWSTPMIRIQHEKTDMGLVWDSYTITGDKAATMSLP